MAQSAIDLRPARTLSASLLFPLSPRAFKEIHDHDPKRNHRIDMPQKAKVTAYCSLLIIRTFVVTMMMDD
jgi:hypothetical protein